MDSKKIKVLLTSVEKCSLTAAATELGYTQSGITHMVKSLEEELGLSLLVRSKTGVRLSAQGKELLPKMKAFLAATNNLEHEAERLRQSSCCSLRLGSYSSITRQWLPEVLSECNCDNCDSRIQITMTSIEELYSAVSSNILDCALVSYQPSLCQGILWYPLWEDELIAILPQSMSVEKNEFPLEHFNALYFLMPSLGFELDIAPLFFSEGRNIQPNISRGNLDDTTILSMVEHGLGVSILSRLITKDMPYKVNAMSLFPKCYRSLGLIVSEQRAEDRDIQHFLECCRSVVKKKHGVDMPGTI